jgi:hypothetical protein
MKVQLSDRAVLGKDVMEVIWLKMRLTQLPTWITPPPSNWGTTERGKLSADNWRVICTIHLNVTLIWIWRNQTGRKKEILSHFMDLIRAVRIANMRLTSPEQINGYNRYIGQYISKIKLLYPDQHLVPSHHAALHIGDMLGSFGPVLSHSAPHFERYINFLHRVNTNSKIGLSFLIYIPCCVSNTYLGELESTMLYTSARHGNLRALLSDNEDIKRAIPEMLSVMETVDSEDARGYRLASILDPNSPTFTPRSQTEGFLEHEPHLLLCEILNQSPNVLPKRASFISEVSFRGVSYGSKRTSIRNSSIIFTDSQDQTRYLPGIIQNIFRYMLNVDDNTVFDNIFLTVEEHIPIEHLEDPFRKYGEFAGFLCKSTSTTLRVIPLSQVKSHFALTRMTDLGLPNHIHVLPIDRVRINDSIFIEY